VIVIGFPDNLKQKLIARLKKRWRKIKNIPPGKRFQERYYYRQNKRIHRTKLKKMIIMMLGLFVILFGVFLWFVPGPGWLTILAGATIMAGESLIVARCLDWLEVKIRSILGKKRDLNILNDKE
jgi:hypothetical protein